MRSHLTMPRLARLRFPAPFLVLTTLVSLTIGWTATTLRAQDPPQAPSGTHALPARPQPRVGKPFGDLVLPTLDGSRSVDLDVYRGRKVLLIEFASW